MDDGDYSSRLVMEIAQSLPFQMRKATKVRITPIFRRHFRAEPFLRERRHHGPPLLDAMRRPSGRASPGPAPVRLSLV